MKRSDRIIKTIRQNIVIFTVLAVLFLLFAIINPNFVDRFNVLSMAQSYVPYAILALGVTFVIATGGVDLSIGATMVASALLAGRFYQLGMPLFLVIPIMIVIGLLIGCLNGLLVAKFKIPSFIATLGVSMAIRGLSAIIVTIPNVIFPTSTWFNATFSNINGFPIGIAWLILFAAISILVIHKSKVGRYILSIGSNEEATRLSGINVKKYKFIAYAICGTFAGIAGIFYSSSFATIVAASGNGMELEALAGAYIGGTSSIGGSVSIIGTLLGSYLLVVIRNGLNFLLPKLNLEFNSTYVTYVLTGVIVVLSILFDTLKKKRVEKEDSKIVPKKKILVTGIISIVLVIGMSIGMAFAVNFHNTKEKTIAVISKGETHAFWRNVASGAEKACKEEGYKLLFRGPPEETPANLPIERDLLQSAISNGVDGIALSCIGEGFSDLLMQTKEANIPVVQFDSGVWPMDYQKLVESNKNPIVSSVLNDNYGCGKLAAEKLFEYLKSDIVMQESYVVGVITHDETVSAFERSDGFIDTFKNLAKNDPLTSNKNVTIELQAKPDSTNSNYKNALDYLKEDGAKAVFMTGEPVITQIYDAIKSGL
ncbi:MAG: substrate-binding domain-containing protein, partial [Bacilli bacterium]|nr:substrate-binding domain-containing protein [Bacilli bacterium]